MNYVQIIEVVQLLASIVTIITVVFLFYQSKIQTISTKNQVYQNFVSNSLEIDHVLIKYPHLRKYVYGNTRIREDEVDVELLMSVIELMIDVVENIHVSKITSPRRDVTGGSHSPNRWNRHLHTDITWKDSAAGIRSRKNDTAVTCFR